MHFAIGKIMSRSIRLTALAVDVEPHRHFCTSGISPW